MAQVQYFLQLDNIPGGSKNPWRAGWISVVNYHPRKTRDPKGAEVVLFVIAPGQPSAVHLLEYARDGRHIQKGRLDVFSSGLFRTMLTIEDALVMTEIQYAPQPGDPPGAPTMLMTLALNRFQWFV